MIKRFISSIQQYTDGFCQALEQSLRAAVDLDRTMLELLLGNALLRLQINILKRQAEHPKRTQCDGDD